MLRIFLLFVILLAGIVCGPIFAGHQGYVLIQTTDYNIETSVTGLVIMLVILLVVLWAVESLLRKLFRTGSRTRSWFVGRKRTRARKQTEAGLIKLAEGDYLQVEKLMTRNADHAEQPVVNYLLAAEAAQQRNDTLRTNQYLERAAEMAGNDQLPVDITRVRIQLAQGENHAARHSIDRLLNLAPRHPAILRLAEQAYLSTGAYSALLDILPAMSKTRLHTDDEIEALQQQAYIGIMDQIMDDDGSEGLKHWWKNLNRKIRHQTSLQVAMAEHLIQCDDNEMAQQVITEGLKRQYNERLVTLIPQVKNVPVEIQEKLLRQLIRQQGDNPQLNSTLGQVLAQHAEWQKAREAFQAALKQRPDATDYAALANVLDKLNLPQEAAAMRRAGLDISLNNHHSV